MNKNIILVLFAILCAVQLALPLKTVIDKQELLNEGATYRFRLQPVDPVDPFRGRYITLRFADRTYKYPSGQKSEVTRGDKIYVELTVDKDGFAMPSLISTEIPEGLYIEAKVQRNNWRKNKTFIDYPFDRFYMQEEKAKRAETITRRLRSDSIVAYAEVVISNGEGVLKDVKVGKKSLQDVINEESELTP